MHKKTKNLPLPRRGRGAGGWGRKSKLKAGAVGNKEGKPPLGHHSGRGSQCRAGLAPLGYLFGRDYKCRRRSNTGVPGAEPPAK